MNNKWVVFEKVFAAIEIVIAEYTIWRFDYVAERDYPISQIISDTNVFILHLLFLAGGLLLLFGKKAGWMISITIWSLLMIGFGVFMFSQNGLIEDDVIMLIACFAVGISFVIFILKKPFLEKYQVSKKDWLIIAGMVPVIVILACWHHLF